MNKFAGWRTAELQYVASLMAGRDLENSDCSWRGDLYNQVIREIRDRRIAAEEFQKKLHSFNDKMEKRKSVYEE